MGYISVISATWEDNKFEASLGKMRFYLKNKIKGKKRVGDVFQVLSVLCLACLSPGVQSPVLKKKTKKHVLNKLKFLEAIDTS
jgi:hypothetical protein